MTPIRDGDVTNHVIHAHCEHPPSRNRAPPARARLPLRQGGRSDRRSAKPLRTQLNEVFMIISARRDDRNATTHNGDVTKSLRYH